MRFKDMRYLILAPDGNFYIGRTPTPSGSYWIEVSQVVDDSPWELIRTGSTTKVNTVPMANMLVSQIIQAWELP